MSGELNNQAMANEEELQGDGIYEVDNQTLCTNDPFQRVNIIEKVKCLLKKAYKSNQPYEIDEYTSLSSNFSLEYFSLDENVKNAQAYSIWKELFDYFDFYNDRAKSMQELDDRIERKRSEIPQKINIILNLDYSRIKQVMDDDIKKTMFSILDYSKLYENKIYIDQLCYLNLLIQDDLNNICYIESLYPSIRCLKNDQALYADPKFDSTAKTLLLWHKIVKDLMLKSDKLGKFLGFSSRPEYSKFWKWFEQRLNYSRFEYEKVQEWLNGSLVPAQSESHSPSSLPSPVVVLTNPSMNLSQYLSENKSKISRQISYLIMKQTSLESDNIQSSISVSLLSEPTPPEPLQIQQDHLFASIVHHLDSFIKHGKNTNFNQLTQNESVKFNLNTDEQNNEEPDDEITFENCEINKENQNKIFRAFLRKRLRKHGLTKTFEKIREMLLMSLSHALLSLQIDKSELNATDQLTIYHLIPYHHKCLEIIKKFYHNEGSIKYGVQSDSFIRLGLPSFRPLFIYLNNVILELMHLCIQMQNENKGVIKKYLDSKFSLLSIEVLTNELRECIEQAILVRQTYYHMIYTVFEVAELDIKHQLERDLFKYDDDLKVTISIYLDFITNWVQDLIKVSNFDKALSVLENEWNFCKNNLYFVTATEDIFASRFCNMGLLVYESLTNMINAIDAKYKEPIRIDIDKILWDEKIKNLDSNLASISIPYEKQDLDSEDNTSIDINLERQDSGSSKLNLDFNEFKEEINKSRKHCLRALKFTAEFLTDLELAAKYQVLCDLQYLLDKLQSSDHVLVNFTNKELLSDSYERSFLIFVPKELSNERIQIARLLFLISAKDNFESTEANKFNRVFFSKSPDQQKILEQTQSKKKPISALMKHFRRNSFMLNSAHNKTCYLLFVQLSENKELWSWNGQKINLYASRPVKLSLYHHLRNPSKESNSKYLYLLTSKQSILFEKKIELKQKLKGCITLVKEKASFHPSIDESITVFKDKIYELSTQCTQWIKSLEADLIPDLSSEVNNSDLAKIQLKVNEILRVSYLFGIELQNEITKFMTQNRADSYAQGLAEFSIQWCNYIVSKTNRGKGRTTRPWAANKGLHLVQIAVVHSVHLNNWDFTRLVQAIERCFSHLIGDLEQQDENLSLAIIRKNSSTSPIASKKVQDKYLPPRIRFEQACIRIDQQVEEKFFTERKIGKQLDLNRQDWIIAGNEVQFRWQLGLLIGEGSFGKVYSCVNLDTWEPMALKIIEFKRNIKIKNLQQIADEINNVVDICHENLVKVYGSELHRKELFIFMEFCGDQCTLDRLSRDASGLPENLVRKYTKSLLKGVEHLHEKNIIHRDIKGANIFLKSIDNRHPEKVVLKLGDFGCSIRLKDPIGTASRDQVTGLRGTYAFMAPEVMASGGSKNQGYTYSADIWSIGCVVIEMFTGKRPWHPLKDEAILFKLHLCFDGERRPACPACISDEAAHFLNCCLDFKPENRKNADQLLEHSFLKIPKEEFEY